MDIESLLELGGTGSSEGKSPLERKRERQQQQRESKGDIVDYARTHTLVETAVAFGTSSSSIAKLCVPLVRKGEVDAQQLLGDEVSLAEIVDLIYTLHTTSVRKLTEEGPFSDAQIRIAKASLEQREQSF